MYHYPNLAKSKSSKEQTWGNWVLYQNITGEPDGIYIRRSWSRANNTYKCCDIGSKNARYLLNAEWVNKTLFDVSPTEDEHGSGILKSKYESTPKRENKKTSTLKDIKPGEAFHNKTVKIGDEEKKSVKGETMTDFPGEITLDNAELFKYEGGSVKIETRGKRNYDDIYFSAYDVGLIFKIDRLDKTLFGVTSSFVNEVDYKIFNCGRSTDLKNTFLTYEGLFSLASKARNNTIASDFRRWGLRIIYSAHIGTQDDRIWAASQSMGISCLKMSNLLYNTFSGKIAGIYLLFVGKMADHRENVNNESEFKDSVDIYKVGLSRDVARRLKEHQQPSGFGKNIIMLKFAVIDVEYLSDAETFIKGHMSGLGEKVEYRKSKSDSSFQTEVFSMDGNKINTVKELFISAQSKYIGKEKGEVEKIKNMEEKIISIERERENEHLELKRVQAEQEKINILRQAAQDMKDSKTTQEIEKLKSDQDMKDTLSRHERELFEREREQFVKDNKVRDDYLESQKVHYETAIEIEKLKATILKMEIQARLPTK